MQLLQDSIFIIDQIKIQFYETIRLPDDKKKKLLSLKKGKKLKKINLAKLYKNINKMMICSFV